jgi:hypothetical protein
MDFFDNLNSILDVIIAALMIEEQQQGHSGANPQPFALPAHRTRIPTPPW